MPAKPNWAVISITEPMSAFGQAKLKDGWHKVLRLEFHDLDVENEPYVLMDKEMARQVVKFARDNSQEIEGILVHCNAGVSRSAAIALWIADEFGLQFNRQYHLHNKHVYKLLREAAHD